MIFVTNMMILLFVKTKIILSSDYTPFYFDAKTKTFSSQIIFLDSNCKIINNNHYCKINHDLVTVYKSYDSYVNRNSNYYSVNVGQKIFSIAVDKNYVYSITHNYINIHNHNNEFIRNWYLSHTDGKLLTYNKKCIEIFFFTSLL
jgi:hypothetical protein